MKMLAAAARADDARGGRRSSHPLGRRRSAFFSGTFRFFADRRERLRVRALGARAQASRRLAHGDAVGAAAARLSVGDATGAAKALLRARREMAAALMLSLPSGSFAPPGHGSRRHRRRPRLRTPRTAARACELGRGTRRWRRRRRWNTRRTPVAPRLSPRRAPPWTPRRRARRASPSGARASVAGQEERASRLSVGASSRSPPRSSATSGPPPRRSSRRRRRAAGAARRRLGRRRFARRRRAQRHRLGRNATARRTRVEVTTLRCYLSAITLQSAGYTPAQRSLFHRQKRAQIEQPRFPHQRRLRRCRALKGGVPVDAAEGLTRSPRRRRWARRSGRRRRAANRHCAGRRRQGAAAARAAAVNN